MENLIIDSREFENNKLYNSENFFSAYIELNKTCYFKGESIKGSITLKPKDIIKKSLLLCPIIANITLQEEHNNGFSSGTTEEVILFKFPMNAPKFEGQNLIEGMTIPFELQVPQNSYPSCIFEENCYVRHILIFDFSSIELKKSAIIIIKNSQYYSAFNELYKSPVEVSFNRVKHKYAIFNIGNINAIAKLEKNVFCYDEVVPIQIDINCPNLKMKIQKVHISIYLTMSRNSKLDHKKSLFKSEKIVFTKIIKLLKKKDKYHLEDIIHLSKGNPDDIYKELESDNKISSDIFKNILLCPTCYGGLLTCEYNIKLTFETDTLFSTNESLCIPIDFYARKREEYKFEENDFELKSKYLPLISNILSTPMPMSKKVQKEDDSSLYRSNTQSKDLINSNILERNKTVKNNRNDSDYCLFNNELDNNKKKSNINNNNNSDIIQEMVTAEKEIESFDAPPCIIQDESNKNQKK